MVEFGINVLLESYMFTDCDRLLDTKCFSVCCI